MIDPTTIDPMGGDPTIDPLAQARVRGAQSWLGQWNGRPKVQDVLPLDPGAPDSLAGWLQAIEPPTAAAIEPEPEPAATPPGRPARGRG